MARTLGWMTLVAAVGWGAGCRMCNAPYDYCGPVYQEGYQTPDFYGRRGSILGPGDPARPTAEASMPDPEPTMAPMPETQANPPASATP